jgi:Rrf2 family protein
MFSSTAEYALRAVVFLATQGEKLSSSHVIAEVTKVPAGYLSKVLKDLADAGVVTSQRGPRGGFSLAKPADQLTVLDVINAVDRIQRIRKCPLGIPSHGTHLCRLHQKLDDAIALIEDAFGSSTIAEMVEPTKAGSKCLFPTIKGARPAAR